MESTSMDREYARYEKALETIDSFNRLLQQSRIAAGTVVAALVGVGLRVTLEPGGYVIAALLQLGVAGLVVGYHLLDRYYWNLLVAAVDFAEELETQVLKLATVTSRAGGVPIIAHGQTDYISQRVRATRASRTQWLFTVLLLGSQILLAGIYGFLAITR